MNTIASLFIMFGGLAIFVGGILLSVWTVDNMGEIFKNIVYVIVGLMLFVSCFVLIPFFLIFNGLEHIIFEASGRNGH